MTNIFKREITIHDKDGKRFDLVIENNGDHFSICSQSGQGQFNPKSDIQQQLLDIWNTYHLNGMSPGTKKQMEIVNLLIDKSYDNACKVLKEQGLYEVEYKGETYRYGSGWIYKDFPENFEEDLFNLIDKLIEEEDEYNDSPITIEDIDNEDFLEHANEKCEGEVEKLMSACIHCGVSWSGLDNVSCNLDGNYWDIEGWEYYIYTDEEANEAHRDYIENLVDDIGFEGFKGGNDINVDMDDYGITISKSISISHNERCYSLAGYDGYENEVNVNGTTYYLYRNN